MKVKKMGVLARRRTASVRQCCVRSPEDRGSVQRVCATSGTCLDFGGGSGVFLPTLSKRFAQVTLLDLEASQAAYDSARAHRSQTVAQQTQAAAAVRQAEAQAHQAEANLTTAEFNLSERAVRAQVAGEVQDIYFRQGEYANAGAPVVAVLPPANVFVRFFVPEPQVSQLMLGSTVPMTLAIDGSATTFTWLRGCPVISMPSRT